jgi:NAD(P)H-flavin reductase
VTILGADRLSPLSNDVRATQPEGPPTRIGVIQRVYQETPESATYWLTFRDGDGEGYAFEPGQFNMLYLFGVGEVAISISSDPAHPERLGHTIRSVGMVTNAMRELDVGDELGIRGPLGRPWPLKDAEGGDLVVIGGGVGVCPVRPAMEFAMRHRERYRRLILLMGARTPELLPYREQLEDWVATMEALEVELHLTVDEASHGWPHHTGVVTTLFPEAHIDPERTTAFVCGPEIMMRFAGRGLVDLGVPSERVWVSMERHMQCGMQLCGHCQLGPLFVCSDGPVFRWDVIAPLMEVREL